MQASIPWVCGAGNFTLVPLIAALRQVMCEGGWGMCAVWSEHVGLPTQ